LTVNNDEKHDYLSRGATLQIRDTGAFAVYGPEDRGKVEWKFEYLFTPRISTSTGEVVPNEKVSNLSRKHRFVPWPGQIVVPLGFYVSPNFFIPERALTTHLLTVFKKTLTPNIVSEKVKPPHVGKPPAKIIAVVPPPHGPVNRTIEAIAKAVTSISIGGFAPSQ